MQEKFSQLASVVSDWCWETDAELRFTFSSERCRDVLGLPPDSLLGRRLVDVAGSEGGSVAWRAVLDAVAGRRPFDARELSVPAIDGVARPVTLSGRPVFGAENVFAGYVGVGRTREARLAQSAESFRSLFADSPLPKWVYSTGTLKFLEVNAAAVAKYGYSRDEFLAMTLKDIRPPEDVQRLESWLRDTAEQRLRSTSWKHLCKDGRLLEVESFARDIVFDGQPARLAEVIDSTALRGAERQTERIFETSQDLIHVTDGYGNYVRINPSSEKVLGYSPAEMLGRNAQSFIHPPDLDLMRNRMRLARYEGTPFADFRCRYGHRDGHVVSIVWSGAWSEPDRLYFFIGRDMTEYDRTQDLLRQSQKMEAVGQLTGGVAHDFNNILLVIMAKADMLEADRRLDSASLADVRDIGKAAQRAADLTRQLLAFSRKQSLRPQPTNINDLVATTGELLRRTLAAHVELDSSLADDLWNVEVDRSQLEAALLNLCVNARDAMTDSGRLLIETANATLDEEYVRSHPDSSVGDHVMLAVTDTGSGIPAESLSKVFEPFFTTKDVGKGTGLGLSMVYGFIKQSNGHVTIQSEVGRGTSVRIFLPRSVAPRAADDVARVPALQEGSERVLVAEDNALVRAGVIRQLRSLGYDVTGTADGAAALAAFETAPKFDLLLTDVIMPGHVTGKQLADEVERRWPGTPVVFMSGYPDDVLVHGGRLDAGVRLLNKPFRISDLARIVRQALDAPST